jgi:peptide/nickel transport system permease protein
MDFLTLMLFDPYTVRLDMVLAPPSWVNLLGTDDLGRDVLARLLMGVYHSLMVGGGVLLMTSFIGIPLGILAGWFGGWVAFAVGKLAELVLSFPGLLLALALAALLGGSLANVIFALGVLGWVGFYRLTYVQVQLVRKAPYIAAAEISGVTLRRLWVWHLLPNCLGPLRVEALLVVAGSMVAEAGLSFLGLGIPAPEPSLGGMLRDGMREMLTSPLLVVAPGVLLICLSVGVNVLAHRRWALPVDRARAI